ncbi:hypothetical protein NR798_02420 [Archangium gephyra]|uniref:hypothetical protein n=1 Tax=Archangium gephyra TaxID=48 RepID=UPI0035D4EC22
MSTPGIAPRQAEQPQAVQHCPHAQGHLTLEAFSRMTAGGSFSVWELTKSVKLSSELQALRRFIGYHGVHLRDPSQAYVLLQVELNASDTNEFQQVMYAWLDDGRKQTQLQVWQDPASSGEGPRLLLEGTVNLLKLQTAPHKLRLLGGEGGSVPIAILGNIMLR